MLLDDSVFGKPRSNCRTVLGGWGPAWDGCGLTTGLPLSLAGTSPSQVTGCLWVTQGQISATVKTKVRDSSSGETLSRRSPVARRPQRSQPVSQEVLSQVGLHGKVNVLSV